MWERLQQTDRKILWRYLKKGKNANWNNHRRFTEIRFGIGFIEQMGFIWYRNGDFIGWRTAMWDILRNNYLSKPNISHVLTASITILISYSVAIDVKK